ncbi:MAG TPA: hypothetical protein VIH37_09700 [Candidatus Limnocylindrales bacterium]
MDELKPDAREAVDDAKKAWRGRDGEDLGDKAANLGDDVRRNIANAGDAIKHAGDDLKHDAEHGTDPDPPR